MTAQEKIDVIQAKEQGRTIQFRVRKGSRNELKNSQWYGYEWKNPEDSYYWPSPQDFNFTQYDYRVKPEPREFKIYCGGMGIACVNGSIKVGEEIRVREVL